MKAGIAMACVLAFVSSLDGQITASLTRSPAGDEVTIRNSSDAALSAFVVAISQTPISESASKAPFVVYSDPLIDAEARPLSPGADRVVAISMFVDASTKRIHRLFQEPIRSAGVFADGTTAGNALLLTRFMFRRSNMLMAVETALEALTEAGQRNVPRHQLFAQFRKMADSMNRWYLSAEQQAGRSVYQTLVGKLMNLPEPEVGSPFPPTAFVAEETARLNRQRVVLLDSQPALVDAAWIERSVVPASAQRVRK